MEISIGESSAFYSIDRRWLRNCFSSIHNVNFTLVSFSFHIDQSKDQRTNERRKLLSFLHWICLVQLAIDFSLLSQLERHHWIVFLYKHRIFSSTRSLMSLNVLCYILLTMSKLMSPFTPFLAEYKYQILRKSMPQSSSSSASSAEQDSSVHFQMIPQSQFVPSKTFLLHFSFVTCRKSLVHKNVERAVASLLLVSIRCPNLWSSTKIRQCSMKSDLWKILFKRFVLSPFWSSSWFTGMW